MRSAALFIVGLLILGGLYGGIEDIVGEANVAVVFWGGVAALIALLAFLGLLVDIQARKDARDIVADWHEEVAGPFTQWFDRQTKWANADLIPISKAPKLVAQAYNGLGRITVLFQEGLSDVLADDLTEVFGQERAEMVFGALREAARPAPVSIGPSIAGLMVGFKLGHDAVRRR